MPFVALICLIAAATVIGAVYCCVRFGFAETRRLVRKTSSRMLVVFVAFAVMLISAVYCYDYLSVLVKDVLTTGAAKEFSETVKLFFGTSSVFASVKALLISCVMLGLLSCVTLGLSCLNEFNYTVEGGGQWIICGAENRVAHYEKVSVVKPFLTFAKYIS